MAGNKDTKDDVAAVLRHEVKSALARWALRRRRQRRGGEPKSVPAHDEATHAPDGRKRFAEDYTFAGVQAGLGLMLRLEWLPGRDSHRLWVVVFREGSALALGGGQLLVRDTDRDRWRAGGLELDCVKPHERWTIRFTGHVRPAPGAEAATAGERRCSVDLTFVADAAPFSPGSDDDPDLIARHLGAASWDAGLLRSVRRVQSRGYVQLGVLHGSVALGDELLPVRASCLRQHTWGVRDWGASDRAFQCFAAFDDGQRAWVHSAQFPFATLEGGFVRRPGAELMPVRSIGVSAEHRPQRVPAHASVELACPDGAVAVEAQMVSDVTLTVDGRGEIGLGFFQLNGPDEEPAGYGIWGAQRRALPRRRVG